MKQPCLSQTCTWSSPVCTVLCSFHSGRHRSRPSGRACVNESACSSVSQNHSVTGFPLHSTNVMSETSGQIQTQRLQQCVEGQLTFNDSPGIQSSSDPLPSSLDHRVAANHGKWSAFLHRNTKRDGCFYFNLCPTWESWERVCFFQIKSLFFYVISSLRTTCAVLLNPHGAEQIHFHTEII